MFCENWLSGIHTLQSVGPIFNGPAVDCMNIEGCPRMLVTNYHSVLIKFQKSADFMKNLYFMQLMLLFWLLSGCYSCV